MEGRKKEKRERRRKDKKYEEVKGRKEIVIAHQGDELRVNCLALLLLSQTLETKGRHKDKGHANKTGPLSKVSDTTTLNYRLVYVPHSQTTTQGNCQPYGTPVVPSKMSLVHKL